MSRYRNTESSSKGMRFLDVLTLIFITLKLLKIITWSWFWVLSPTWGVFLLVIIIRIILEVFRKLQGEK